MEDESFFSFIFSKFDILFRVPFNTGHSGAECKYELVSMVTHFGGAGGMYNEIV